MARVKYFNEATGKWEYADAGGLSLPVADSRYIKVEDRGAAEGIATLDADGKIPAHQLPSDLDDVVEYDTRDAFPVPGESGKLYVALDKNTTYRWNGSTYVKTGSTLEIGTTETTAAAGNHGHANATDTEDGFLSAEDKAKYDGYGTAISSLTTEVANKAPAYTYGTEELESGTSELPNGTLYFCYE